MAVENAAKPAAPSIPAFTPAVTKQKSIHFRFINT